MNVKRIFSRGAKFHQSLMTRYLIIILFAFMFIPIVFPLASLMYLLIGTAIDKVELDGLKYGNASFLETMWHQEAAQMEGYSAQQINDKLHEMKASYPEASFFWVDDDGNTQLQLSQDKPLPVHWSHAESIRFMKEHVGGDPFTVVAFIGKNNEGPGFIVLQMPRSLLQATSPIGVNSPFYVAFIFIMFTFFILMSLLFFQHIRKRLLRLQAAMTLQDRTSLPMPIVQKKQDEIGQLEAAFNQMVEQLRDSQQRQREEEELRKRLISNLSHDLRTPLTVLNSHIYSLRKEELTVQGQQSIKQMEYKIDGLSRLIENLLTYTMMSSGRYPLKLEQVDVLRLVREGAAAWYPLWEKEGIKAEIELPDQPLLWEVDKEGFRRILDNLFQNIVRHAAKGNYIGLSVEQRNSGASLVIADHGDGVHTTSDNKGAGIGLAIVDYLIREMGLGWHTDSSTNGTRVYIFKHF